MVTKMKMFGLFSQNYLVNKSLPLSSAPPSSAPPSSAPPYSAPPSSAPPYSAPPSSAPPASAPPAPGLKQFNMASIMKMQSSGCKSCRG